MHLTFLCLINSLPFLHDYDVKLPKFGFQGGRKTANTKYIFLLNLNMVLRNSTPEEFAYI